VEFRRAAELAGLRPVRMGFVGLQNANWKMSDNPSHFSQVRQAIGKREQ
jgi:hypothetical protein